MQTGAYITWLSKRIGGNLFSRETLREAINQAQNEILGRDILFMKVRPNPFLFTTDGTLEYVASTEIYDSVDGETQFDIRKVSRLYSPRVRRSPLFEYGGFSPHSASNGVQMEANGEATVVVDCIQSSEPESDDCLIRLRPGMNLGTTTEIFLAECYKWPTQILSENDAITLPSLFQRNLLRYAVLKELEYTEYGSAEKPETLYEEELAKFDLWSSRGAKTDPTSTPFREC